MYKCEFKKYSAAMAGCEDDATLYCRPARCGKKYGKHSFTEEQSKVFILRCRTCGNPGDCCKPIDEATDIEFLVWYTNETNMSSFTEDKG